MADTRTVDELIDVITAMQVQIDDLSSTTAVRSVIRPTGTLEQTVRTTAPTGALLCQGQSVLRADYPNLFQFATDQAILGGSNPVFGVGDGSTTFTLPNITGRVLVCAGTLGADTYVLGTTVGTAKPTLTTGQVPPHSHNVAVGAHATHDHNVGASHSSSHTHGFTTSSGGSHAHGIGTDGDHYGHAPDSGPHLCASGSAIGAAAWNMLGAHFGGHSHGGTDTEPAHTHSGTTGNDGSYTHTISETTTGPTTHSVSETALGAASSIDVRQPGYVTNVMIWT